MHPPRSLDRIYHLFWCSHWNVAVRGHLWWRNFNTTLPCVPPWQNWSTWWRCLYLGHVLFFSMFLVTFFFHQTYAGARKKNKMPKEKKLAQCPRLPDRQMTYRTNCVKRSHAFVYFLPSNDRVKQLPVATKVWLFPGTWPLFSGKERARIFNRNVHQLDCECIRLAEIARYGKLHRGLDSRPNTYPDVFVKARPHYYQQSLRSMISTNQQKRSWLLVFSD